MGKDLAPSQCCQGGLRASRLVLFSASPTQTGLVELDLFSFKHFYASLKDWIMLIGTKTVDTSIEHDLFNKRFLTYFQTRRWLLDSWNPESCSPF